MNQSNSKHSGRVDAWYDMTTRLNNYIRMQEEVARKRGCWEQLKATDTLTKARKIVYGVKNKNSAL